MVRHQKQSLVAGVGSMDEHEGVPAGPHDELDFLIARFDALLVRIKESVKSPRYFCVQVEDEICEGIHHVFNAMELIVDWMERRHRIDRDALLLLQNLKAAQSALAQCVGACPEEMVTGTL